MSYENKNFNAKYGQGQHHRPEEKQIGVVKKIENFYDSATGKIRSDLFNEYAEKVAGSFVSSEGGVSSTQLRRLFDEVKRYERLLTENDPKSWDEQLPYIKMIRSKVFYAAARAKKNARQELRQCYDNLIAFISEGIGLIKTQKDYQIFSSLFEAVYGFYYAKKPNNA